MYCGHHMQALGHSAKRESRPPRKRAMVETSKVSTTVKSSLCASVTHDLSKRSSAHTVDSVYIANINSVSSACGNNNQDSHAPKGVNSSPGLILHGDPCFFRERDSIKRSISLTVCPSVSSSLASFSTNNVTKGLGRQQSEPISSSYSANAPLGIVTATSSTISKNRTGTSLLESNSNHISKMYPVLSDKLLPIAHKATLSTPAPIVTANHCTAQYKPHVLPMAPAVQLDVGPVPNVDIGMLQGSMEELKKAKASLKAHKYSRPKGKPRSKRNVSSDQIQQSSYIDSKEASSVCATVTTCQNTASKSKATACNKQGLRRNRSNSASSSKVSVTTSNNTLTVTSITPDTMLTAELKPPLPRPMGELHVPKEPAKSKSIPKEPAKSKSKTHKRVTKQKSQHLCKESTVTRPSAQKCENDDDDTTMIERENATKMISSKQKRHTIGWCGGPGSTGTSSQSKQSITSSPGSLSPSKRGSKNNPTSGTDLLQPPYPNQAVSPLGVPRKRCMTRPRLADHVMTESEAKRKLKRHSCLKLYAYHASQLVHNHDLLGLGLSSSDDDSDEDLLPKQQNWLVTDNDGDDDNCDDNDIGDDDNNISDTNQQLLNRSILGDIRSTKLSLKSVLMRRRLSQCKHWLNGNKSRNRYEDNALLAMVKAARYSPSSVVKTIQEMLPPNAGSTSRISTKAAVPQQTSSNKSVKGKKKSKHKIVKDPILPIRKCLCKNESTSQSGSQLCGEDALPYTNHCAKHITYNINQQLYDYCTAKFADNTQCCEPVIDFWHELPLCRTHAEKAENYNRNSNASGIKKHVRKKTKQSALTRPPKKGKKRKRPSNKRKQQNEKNDETYRTHLEQLDNKKKGNNHTTSLHTSPLADVLPLPTTSHLSLPPAVTSTITTTQALPPTSVGTDDAEDGGVVDIITTRVSHVVTSAPAVVTTAAPTTPVHHPAPSSLPRHQAMTAINTNDKELSNSDVQDALDGSFTSGVMDRSFELPLNDQDLNDVFSKLPDSTFDLLTDKNGTYDNASRDSGEEFTRSLTEMSKLSASTNFGLLMPAVPQPQSSGPLLQAGDDEDEDDTTNDQITKEIAQSILSQNSGNEPLGGTETMDDDHLDVTDLSNDNITELTNSMSASDLDQMTQALMSLDNNITSSNPLHAGGINLSHVVTAPAVNTMTLKAEQNQMHALLAQETKQQNKVINGQLASDAYAGLEQFIQQHSQALTPPPSYDVAVSLQSTCNSTPYGTVPSMLVGQQANQTYSTELSLVTQPTSVGPAQKTAASVNALIGEPATAQNLHQEVTAGNRFSQPLPLPPPLYCPQPPVCHTTSGQGEPASVFGLNVLHTLPSADLSAGTCVPCTTSHFSSTLSSTVPDSISSSNPVVNQLLGIDNAMFLSKSSTDTINLHPQLLFSNNTVPGTMSELPTQATIDLQHALHVALQQNESSMPKHNSITASITGNTLNNSLTPTSVIGPRTTKESPVMYSNNIPKVSAKSAIVTSAATQQLPVKSNHPPISVFTTHTTGNSSNSNTIVSTPTNKAVSLDQTILNITGAIRANNTDKSRSKGMSHGKESTISQILNAPINTTRHLHSDLQASMSTPQVPLTGMSLNPTTPSSSSSVEGHKQYQNSSKSNSISLGDMLKSLHNNKNLQHSATFTVPLDNSNTIKIPTTSIFMQMMRPPNVPAGPQQNQVSAEVPVSQQLTLAAALNTSSQGLQTDATTNRT